MIYDFLQDKSFLLKVNQYKVREYLAAIMVLDFETESPIARLEGKVLSASMTQNAKSNTRRTCSLSVIFDNDTKGITDFGLIAVDKKISLSIGFKNPFYDTAEYQKYGETLWFKQGIFFITSASCQVSTSTATVSVNLIDKMGQLNGSVGGVLPASTSFHDKIIYDADGNMTTEYPLISDIIKECVHHFGGEHFSRIIVEDVPDVGRIVVKYMGSTPINFQTGTDRLNCGISFVIGSPPINGFRETYVQGDNIGYMETPLTYPGELIMSAGNTVTQVLDEIVKQLGNFEYFYDVDGNFHFRQIPNYLATGKTPLNFDGGDAELQNLYLPRYTDDSYLNEFADMTLVSSISFSPNMSNLKNDFICWGSKNADENTETMVRYHLAVDTRPKDIRRPKKLNPGDDGYEQEEEYRKLIGDNYSLCHKDIAEVRDVNTEMVTRYAVIAGTLLGNDEKWGETVAPALDDCFSNLSESYWFNWREELYRQALLAYGSSTDGSYYDEELMAEWRGIYDPTSTFLNKGSESFQAGWEDHYGADNAQVPWTGYNVAVKVAPETLRYWLDIIDTSASIGRYGVNRIGRRTMVKDNSQINEVFEADIPDIVFILNDGSNLSTIQMKEKTEYYISIGQTYCFINSDQQSYFQEKNSFGTCYEEVRAMLYNNLIYNATVSLSAIPILYMEVNKTVHLNFGDLNIVGDYVINSISWTLGGSGGMMNLNLNEAVVMV